MAQISKARRQNVAFNNDSLWGFLIPALLFCCLIEIVDILRVGGLDSHTKFPKLHFEKHSKQLFVEKKFCFGSKI